LEIEVVVHLFVEEQAVLVEKVGADKQLAEGATDMFENVMDMAVGTVDMAVSKVGMIADMDDKIVSTVGTVSIDFVVGFHAAMAWVHSMSFVHTSDHS